jgi:hypothetical protein
MTEIRSILISNLLMDVQNPRFKDEQENQDEAVRSMIISQRGKIIELAKDILMNNLSPTENFLVIPFDLENGKFIVLEGNRRLAALRLMEDPSKAQDLFDSAQQRQLEIISNEYKKSPITAVNCAIDIDKQNSRHWIELRHQGPRKGAGIVQWGTEEKRRFYELYGERDLTLQVLDYLVEHKVISTEEASHVPITNLWRIVTMPYARLKFGYEVVDGLFQPIGNETRLTEYLKHIVADLSSGRVKTSRIYYKDNRKQYIETVISEIESSQTEEPHKSPQKNGSSNDASSILEKQKYNDGDQSNQNFGVNSQPNLSDANSSPSSTLYKQANNIDTINENGKGGSPVNPEQPKSTEGKANKPRENPSRKDRDFIVPGTFRLKIPPSRSNDIYKELKILNIRAFPNAAAVLLRVFLELSIDHYISRNQVDFPYKPDDRNYSLFHKMEDVGKHLQNKGVLNKQQMEAVNKAVARDSFLDFSISTFHAYVHNPYFSPSPGDLNGAWDKLESFILALWDV